MCESEGVCEGKGKFEREGVCEGKGKGVMARVSVSVCVRVCVSGVCSEAKLPVTPGKG